MSTYVEKFLSKWELEIDESGVDKAIAGTKAIAKGLLAVATVSVAATVGVAAFVSKTASAYSEAGKAARDFGLALEDLQRLETAAELSGLAPEELRISLKDLTRNAVDAKDKGGEAGKQFRKLGIDVKKFADLTPTEKLAQFAAGLEKIDSASERAAIRTKLLGRAGSKMGSLLDGGKSAFLEMIQAREKYGFLASQDDLKKAEKLEDSISLIKIFIVDLSRTLASDLFPPLIRITDSIKGWIAQNKDLVRSKIAEYVTYIGKAFDLLHKYASKAYKMIQNLIKALGGLDNAIRIAGIAMLFLVSTAAAWIAINYGGAILGAAKALATMRVEALLANAATMLLPVAIGLIIALIALMVEDWIAYEKGQDSMIGRLAKKFVWFADSIKFVKAVAIGAWDASKAWFEWWSGSIFGLMDIFETLYTTLSNIFDKLGEEGVDWAELLFKSIQAVLNSIGKAISKIFGPVIDIAASIGLDPREIESLNSFLSGTVSLDAPDFLRQKQSGVVIQNHGDRSIHITTQQGQDPRQIADLVDQKIAERDEALANEIAQSAKTGVIR